MLFYSYGEQEYSKTPVLEYLFNKVAARRSPRYFPVNIQNFKFFYRTLPVAASKWESGKVKTSKLRK